MISTPASVFDKVLHAFETGDLAYSDVLDQLQRVLANGAAPAELSEILRRRESIAPLPPSAHKGILAALSEAIERPSVTPPPGAGAPPPAAPPTPATTEVALEVDAPVVPSAVFEKVLDTFETGGFTYADVLDQLKRLLASGASPSSLIAAMRRRELIDPLPRFAHEEIMERLNNAIQYSQGSNELSAVPAPTLNASTALAAAAQRTAAVERVAAIERALEVERAAATERLRVNAEQAKQEALREAQRHEAELRALREALTVREGQLVALQREHAKVVPGLQGRAQAAARLELDVQELRARTGGLVAELEAARTALEAERAETRSMRLALAERIAASEQEQRRGIQAARDAERQQNEARAARAAEIAARDAELAERDAQAGDLSARLAELDAQLGDLSARLAERDAQLGDLSARLAERDAQLGDLSARLAERDAQRESLRQEHERLVAALEMRTRAVDAVEAERQAARERTASLAAELAPARDALDAERRRSRELAAALAESHASLAAVQEQGAEAARQAEIQQNEGLKVREALAAANAALARVQTALRERDTEIATISAELGALRAAAAAPAAREVAAVVAAAAVRAPSGVAAAPAARAASGVTVAPAARAASAVIAARSAPVAPATVSAGQRPSAEANAGRRIISAVGRPWALGVALLLGACALWFATHRVRAPVPVASPAAAALPAAGTVIRDCATCPMMTVLPAGKFRQGSARVEGSSAFEQPLHAVLIRRPFALSKNAITVDEFRQFVAATQWEARGCDTYDGTWKHVAEADWQSPGFPQTGTHPVTCVSWNDAERYAQWLSARTGHHYRLPSASEWEYAALAGSEAPQPWSAKRSDACEHANVADQSAARRYPGWTAFPCDDGFVYTAPVGSFKANAFGLNDLLGNVFQWTQDCWHPDYRGAPIDGSARTDGDCSEHEMRGGSWFTNPGFVRANYRNHFAADYRTNTVGIRLVRDLGP